ncbi:MAG: hypothetical protein ACIARR_03445 [Phycisphaerales bacterium JB059]
MNKLEIQPPPPPPARPDCYCWSGPLKQSSAHQLRDFVICAAIAAALAFSVLALGLL